MAGLQIHKLVTDRNNALKKFQRDKEEAVLLKAEEHNTQSFCSYLVGLQLLVL